MKTKEEAFKEWNDNQDMSAYRALKEIKDILGLSPETSNEELLERVKQLSVEHWAYSARCKRLAKYICKGLEE